MYAECTFPETERECWKLAQSFWKSFFHFLTLPLIIFNSSHSHAHTYTHTQTRSQKPTDAYMENIYNDTNTIESIEDLNGLRSGLPAKVPLLRHSLIRLALRTWKALVISWFMKLSLFRTLATIIRRSNTSSSSAMVATCIRSPRPSSRLPVYRYWSTAWNQSQSRSQT